MKIGKLLSHNMTVLREQHGLSVIELAKKCGVDRQTIYKLESGENWISPMMVERLAKAYKIEEHVLFQINTSVD